jgi:glycosyltransferase involved in cell wall biosynthesis
MTNSILILNTYSIKNPISGGQRRAAAIADKYRELGLEVYYVGIYSYTSVGPDMNTVGPYDVQIRDKKSLDYIDALHHEYIGDVGVGEVAINDDYVYQELIRRIQKYQPRYIELEHPYLLPFIEKAKSEGHLSDQIIIHSSHNVEYLMKKEMLDADTSITDERKAEIVARVKELEGRLCKVADFTLAVTEADATKFRSFGAKKVIIAPNAIGEPTRDAKATQALRKLREKEGTSKTIVFVGSAHPPNLQGYLDVVGTRLGFLPKGSKLVVAGTVCWMIQDYIWRQSPIEQSTFHLRTQLAGRVSDAELAAILELADLIILPITTGGGSNLKTAEAIYSGKQVLGTEFSFRGFEKYANLPGITLVKTKAEFHQKMAELTTGVVKQPKRSAAEVRRAAEVLWPNALGGLQEIVAS